MKHNVIMQLKRMEQQYKAGSCNRGLVWATACATIQQCGHFSRLEQRTMVQRWDRLAGFAV